MTLPITCFLDNSTHASVDDLHLHLRKLGISQQRYWHVHHPRGDLLTGELIPYTNYHQYMTQDFVNKNNLRKWLSTQPLHLGLAWAKKWLVQRKIDKNLIYAPSQVELRTLLCPSMPYYEKVAEKEGGYYGVTESLGYQPRYTIKQRLIYRTLTANMSIIQDTREQRPVTFDSPVRIDTLNVGDYALEPLYDQGIRIERKSLSDWAGTLSGKIVKHKDGTIDSPYARFARELERATQANLYVVMVVESSITDAQRFNYLPQTKWIKASPSYICHQMRDLLVRYPLSFQIVFCDGRKELSVKIPRILSLDLEQIRTTDLQYCYEKGLL